MRWIGPKYQSGFSGRRLLVLAEARPREAEGSFVGRGLEAFILPGYLDESVKHRQFTDLARMVLGHVATREECVQFYQSVALINMPEAACAAGRPATDAEWSHVESELGELVEELAPQRLLVLGERLVQHVRVWSAKAAPASEHTLELCYATHPAARSFAFRDQWAATGELRAP